MTILRPHPTVRCQALAVALAGCLAICGGRSGAVVRGSEVLSALPGSAPAVPLLPRIGSVVPSTPKPPPAPAADDVEACRDGAAACGCGRSACGRGHCGPGKAGRCGGGCDAAGCPACCPVRPASFGFYGTQWRTWPGFGVVQAAHAEPAAPVMPPKSEVPTVDEESPVPGFELAVPEEAPEPDAGGRPSGPRPPAEEPAAESAPLQPDTLPEPPQPARPAEPRRDDEADNLFDEAALRLRSRERLAMLQQTSLYQERLRRESLRLQASRLARPTVPEVAPAPAAARATSPKRRQAA
ncbi:MAG: hypothetical protein EBZ74_08750, partial [Planctomycetia bacterium]|nr:hypothetical protein [Planctomycetia bacterium]